MPKVSGYLPDELYARARVRSLPLSALTQEAVERALLQVAKQEWIERMRSRPRRDLDLDTGALMAQVRDELAEDTVAPAHQQAEVISALARLVRTGVLDAEQGRLAVADAGELPQRSVPTSARHLARAYELRDRLRVADGLDVALAEELDSPLVTTDLRLARAAPPCAIRHP